MGRALFHPSLMNHSLTMLIYYGRGIIAMPETATHDHLVYCAIGLIYNILISYNLYRIQSRRTSGDVDVRNYIMWSATVTYYA